MAVVYNPKIVNDGLFLYLDPANPKCFVPGQPTCKNLITQGLVTGAAGQPDAGVHTPNPSNFPVYNSINGGIFDFANGKGMNCEEDLGARTELTFSIVFFKKTNTEQYFSDARNNGGQWFLTNYQQRNITYTHALGYNFNGNTVDDYIASGPDFENKWYHMTLTSDASGSKLFLNASEVANYVNSASIVETFGKNFRIGTRYTTSGQWSGYMGPIAAWSRVLTTQEIQQNFNAIRGRYGI
jgi:hypothetical protein